MRTVLPGQPPLEFLRAVLDEDGWGETTALPDGQTLRAVFEGDQATFWAFAKIPEGVDVLVCFTRCPFDAPPERLGAVAELVTRINHGLRVGNFELDLDGGEVRFRNALDFSGVELTGRLALNVLLPCAFTLDRFLPAFDALVRRGRTVREALDAVGL